MPDPRAPFSLDGTAARRRTRWGGTRSPVAASPIYSGTRRPHGDAVRARKCDALVGHSHDGHALECPDHGFRIARRDHQRSVSLCTSSELCGSVRRTRSVAAHSHGMADSARRRGWPRLGTFSACGGRGSCVAPEWTLPRHCRTEAALCSQAFRQTRDAGAAPTTRSFRGT
jgi:hypothetical protein